MTDLLFTSSEATSGGEAVLADLYVGALRARCIAPSDLGSVPQTSPRLVVRQEDTANRDIEIQVSTVNTFASTVWTTTLTNVAPLTDTSIVMGITLVDKTTYYWRCRAVDTAGPTYGPWESRSFTVRMVNGADYQPVMLNGGWTIVLATLPDYQPVMLNGGVYLPALPESDYQPVMLNAGVNLTLGKADYAIASVGDVDTSTPTPALWVLVPTAGREGDGFTLIGMGFGDLQSTYAGVVEIDLQDGSGWQAVSVISWQTFPADPPMYGPSRAIDPYNGIIDPEHGEIEVIVPVGALPPGLLVRVRTNGP